MPYAQEHLVDLQRIEIVRARIKLHDDNIEMVLRLNSPVGEIDRIISYLKFGSLDTTVKHGNEESPPIELNFVDVFVEDFKLLSKYQKSYLTNCDVRCSPKTLEIFAKTCEGKMVFEPMI
ncbi:hypothetical protein L3Y34_009199 [Caenorhabditis briggsae]|nr:hypothetical protein L3Y34_009199 [Caenorhabditis briggsae]